MSGRRLVIIMLISAVLFAAALAGAYRFWGAARLRRMPHPQDPALARRRPPSQGSVESQTRKVWGGPAGIPSR